MKRALTAAALGVALSGCTPEGLWGSEARYAPDLHGYVVERSPGSARHLTLVSPVTGKKLRCREDLERSLAPILRARATSTHDDGLAAAMATPLVLATAPTSLPGSLFFISGTVTGLPAEGLYTAASSPWARTLYRDGKRAFDEHRDRDAERLFELASLKGHGPRGIDWSPDVMRADYLLGVLYEREGRPRDAIRAFKEFVERAQVRDEAAYRDADARLAALDPAALPPCRSVAPLTFSWPSPGMVPAPPSR